MELKCPSCAKLTALRECPRCGAELSTLFVLLETAEEDMRRAAMLLRQGQPASAYGFASRSWEKSHSPEAATLAFLASLGTGDFLSATAWYVHARTDP